MKLSSSTLRKAAEIQERIESLEAELRELLENGQSAAVDERKGSGASAEAAPASVKATPAPVKTGRGRRSTRETPAPVPASNGRGRGRRSTSPTGPLAPAVVKVLEGKGGPMSVADILDGLNASGYKFASAEPKKNLFARIYRLKGVKQVGPGKFAAE